MRKRISLGGISNDLRSGRLTSNELSTGLPLPLPIPQAPRKSAQVMVTPMRVASTLPSSGNRVILQRKYTELEMMAPEAVSRPI